MRLGSQEEGSDPQTGSVVPGKAGGKDSLGSDWRGTSSGQHFHAPTRWLSNWDVRREGVAAGDNDVKSSSAVPVINDGLRKLKISTTSHVL